MAIHWEKVIPFCIKKESKKKREKMSKTNKKSISILCFSTLLQFFLLNIYGESREDFFFEWKKKG